MKNRLVNKLLILMVSLIVAIGFSSCEKGDGDKDYGSALLYMPQATSSGGLTNNYAVPSGEGEYTYNFRIDGNNLKIILGVLRSGKLSNEAYTVDVVSLKNNTDEVVATNEIENAIVLPENLFSIPAKVNVPSDKSGETFYMTVAIDALRSSEYRGKNLVATIAIVNPSKYELNVDKANTVVIIDVNACLDIIDKN